MRLQLASEQQQHLLMLLKCSTVQLASLLVLHLLLRLQLYCLKAVAAAQGVAASCCTTAARAGFYLLSCVTFGWLPAARAVLRVYGCCSC